MIFRWVQGYRKAKGRGLFSTSVMETRNEGLKLENTRFQLRHQKNLLGVKVKPCNRLPRDSGDSQLWMPPGTGRSARGGTQSAREASWIKCLARDVGGSSFLKHCVNDERSMYYQVFLRHGGTASIL